MTPEEIRTTREALRMSQQQFATEIGVSVRSITDWENGRSTPRPLALKALLRLKRKADKIKEKLMETIKAIAAEYNEAVAVEDAQRMQATDDPRELAGNIIGRIDHRIATTSETALLGDALHNLRNDADLEGTFRWWMAAYAKYEAIKDTDEEEGFLEALFEGRLDFA